MDFGSSSLAGRFRAYGKVVRQKHSPGKGLGIPGTDFLGVFLSLFQEMPPLGALHAVGFSKGLCGGGSWAAAWSLGP